MDRTEYFISKDIRVRHIKDASFFEVYSLAEDAEIELSFDEIEALYNEMQRIRESE